MEQKKVLIPIFENEKWLVETDNNVELVNGKWTTSVYKLTNKENNVIYQFVISNIISLYDDVKSLDIKTFFQNEPILLNFLKTQLPSWIFEYDKYEPTLTDKIFRVKINNKGCNFIEIIVGETLNFIDSKVNLIWKEDNWFDEEGDFVDDYAVVERDDMFNFINKQGELLLIGNEWFSDAYDFSEGFAGVEIEGQGWNFIDIKREYLWKGGIMFNDIKGFSQGFGHVFKIGKGWNFINKQGELLWKEEKWFDGVCGFSNGYAQVRKEGKGWNIINTQGELLWEDFKQVDYVYNFVNGVALVYKQDKGWNYIDDKGELLWKEEKWFDEVYGKILEKRHVKYLGNDYILTDNGELIEK
jgi:hypothetical protein